MARHFTVIALITCCALVQAFPDSPPDKPKIVYQPIKLDISPLEPGQMMTFMWQGVPVSVYYRTPDKIDTLSQKQPLLLDAFSQKLKRSEYLKQYSNEYLEIYNDVMHLDSGWVQTPLRSKRDELFVFISSSPLTGCMLKFNVSDSILPTVKIPKGWDGTFMDSCAAVFYDASGRVFEHEKARYNLYVPNHRFLSDTVIELLPEGALVKDSSFK